MYVITSIKCLKRCKIGFKRKKVYAAEFWGKLGIPYVRCLASIWTVAGARLMRELIIINDS